MKKTLTYSQILSIHSGVQSLLNSDTVKLKAIDKFHMIKNNTTLTALVEQFNEFRDKLIVEYGELDNEKDIYEIKPETEAFKKYAKEIQVILADTVPDIELYEININSIDDSVDINAIAGMMDIIVE